MDKELKINKLIDITNVSRAVAIEALETCEWDLVKSIIYLNENNLLPTKNISFLETEMPNENNEYNKKTNLQSLIDKIISAKFIISKDFSVIFTLPLVLTVLLLFIIPKALIVAFIISLFFNFSYAVEHSIFDETINDFFELIRKFIVNIKAYFDINNHE